MASNSVHGIEEKEQTFESQLLWREGNLLRVDESYFNLQIVAMKHQLQIDELEFCALKVNWEEANLFFFYVRLCFLNQNILEQCPVLCHNLCSIRTHFFNQSPAGSRDNDFVV